MSSRFSLFRHTWPAVLSALLCARDLDAAQWRLSRSLALEGIFSDNALLSASDPQTQWQVRIIPGMVLHADSGRSTLAVAYALNYRQTLSGPSSDDLNHRLQANAQVELYRQHLWLDATASIRQELIDPLGPNAGDDSAAAPNTQTVYTYRLAPTYRTALGRFADLSFILSQDGVFYAAEGTNSVRHGAQFGLHGTRATAFNWQFTSRYDRTVYENDIETDSAVGRITAAYAFTPAIGAGVTVGYERHENTGFAAQSGMLWESALLWTPNPRTRLRFGVGRRYFGWSPVLEWSHRHKRSLWTASYQRDRSSARQERLQNTAFTFEDEFGVARDPVTGEPRPLTALDAAPTTTAFVSDDFRLRYALRSGRSTVAVNAAYRLRHSEGTDRKETAMQLGVQFNRRLTPFLGATLGATWNHHAIDNERTTSTSYGINLGLNRTLSRRLSTQLRYLFLAGEDYSENRVTLGMLFHWAD